jgi:hypothetical protein
MRRVALASLLALVAGSAAGAAAMAPVPAPNARLTSFVCQKARDPAERAVSITAVMRPVPGTMKMAMRFELLKRARRRSRPVALTGTDLGTWLTPTKDPTLGSRPGDRWVVNHPVTDLAGPAFYRFSVAFRWTDASSHVIGRAVRTSPLCFQPERRADIQVVAINVTPVAGSSGSDAYVAHIRNTGKTATGPFQVELSDGVPANTVYKSVAQVLPHHQRGVYFRAPACSAAAPVTITADPTQQVDVSSRSHSSMTTTCASAAPAMTRSRWAPRRR